MGWTPAGWDDTIGIVVPVVIVSRQATFGSEPRGSSLKVHSAGRALPSAAFLTVTATYVVALVLTYAAGGFPTVAAWGSGGWIGAVLGTSTYLFAAVGALITLRRRRNAVGWLCLSIGMVWATLGALEAYVHYAIDVRGGSVAGFEVALAMSSVGWVPAIGLMIFLILLFPDGRLPSRRWRVVAAFAALTLVVIATAGVFGPANFADSGFPEVANPFRIDALAPALEQIQAAALLLPVWILVAAVSIVVRYRRASGVERLQLKWLVASGMVVAAAFVVAMAAPNDASGEGPSLAAEIAQDVSLLSYALIPIAIGIATLRYRLYDIDLIVNRTLVYGGATLVLALAFGAANVASQRMLESMSGQRSDLVTAALAVAAAFAFGPMRRRIRPLVDRFLPARARLALLFTDIVGSTRIAAEIGDQRWRQLADRYRTAVRRELARFAGREMDTAGDGFFVTFERPAAALACAWAIRGGVRALGIETRIGVHVGECEMRGEKVSGLAVHTAARVMSAAADGEILVSGSLREAVTGLNVELADRGLHDLKGIPGAWRLYQVEALAPTG